VICPVDHVLSGLEANPQSYSIGVKYRLNVLRIASFTEMCVKEQLWKYLELSFQLKFDRSSELNYDALCYDYEHYDVLIIISRLWQPCDCFIYIVYLFVLTRESKRRGVPFACSDERLWNSEESVLFDSRIAL